MCSVSCTKKCIGILIDKNMRALYMPVQSICVYRCSIYTRFSCYGVANNIVLMERLPNFYY